MSAPNMQSSLPDLIIKNTFIHIVAEKDKHLGTLARSVSEPALIHLRSQARAPEAAPATGSEPSSCFGGDRCPSASSCSASADKAKDEEDDAEAEVDSWASTSPGDRSTSWQEEESRVSDDQPPGPSVGKAAQVVKRDRLCKRKRERRQAQSERIILAALADPLHFDLSAIDVPPTLAKDEEAMEKLKAQLEQIAREAAKREPRAAPCPDVESGQCPCAAAVGTGDLAMGLDVRLAHEERSEPRAAPCPVVERGHCPRAAVVATGASVASPDEAASAPRSARCPAVERGRCPCMASAANGALERGLDDHVAGEAEIELRATVAEDEPEIADDQPCAAGSSGAPEPLKRDRPCKKKRERRKAQAERLVAAAMADPTHFDLDDAVVPQGLANDEDALSKLKARLKQVSCSAGSESLSPC